MSRQPPARLLAAALALATMTTACKKDPPDPAFAAEWKTWHDAREQRLRRPQGWLALVGLHWLKDGENRVEGLPGTFVLKDGQVTLRAAAADGYTLEGAQVTERQLAPDAADKPDRLTVGSKAVEALVRGDQYALRVWDAQSPILAAFHGIEAYPADPRWRLEARWEAYATPREVEVPSAAGPASRAFAPGRAHFTVDGQEVTLEPTQDGDELWFVFKDATAPAETYGAGRFLYAGAPKDGKVVLDFNRAYNPPCAFTPYATCPLPLPQNVLKVRIEAGEKKYGEH
ncbi:MAG: DUF1684 domain-containing protein [Anaeromyxobacter sp.]